MSLAGTIPSNVNQRWSKKESSLILPDGFPSAEILREEGIPVLELKPPERHSNWRAFLDMIRGRDLAPRHSIQVNFQEQASCRRLASQQYLSESPF